MSTAIKPIDSETHAQLAIEKREASQLEAENVDAGNAARFVKACGADFRCAEGVGLLVWDGRRFRRDPDGSRILRLATKHAKREFYYAKAQDTGNDKVAEAVLKAKRANLHRRMLTNMIALAQVAEEVAVAPAALDADPWLLNLLNGTLDLRTGILKPHNRADLLTKLAPATFDPDAKCPTFDAFLARVMGGDEEMIAFILRILGYGLTGSAREQVIFFLHGHGENGKSTLNEAMAALLGEYAISTPAKTLLADKQEGHATYVARLHDARFVVSSETRPGVPLSEERVKLLTGGDTIAANFMYHDAFEFIAQFKIYFAVNHLPTIPTQSHAIWRRIIVIPFNVRIPRREWDTALPAKLAAERSGILNRLLEGCREWLRRGKLNVPISVIDAINEYRAEQDKMVGFLNAKFVSSPDGMVESTRAYDLYREFCTANGVQYVLGRPRFLGELKDRGLRVPPRSHGKQWICGIEERTEEE